MLLLLAIPILSTVALAHRYLQCCAPSNVLVRNVRKSSPTLRIAVALLVVALTLAGLAHVVERAIVEGAPGWLNLVVLALAWDSIKIGVLGGVVLARGSLSIVQQALRRGTGGRYEGSASARWG